MSDPGVEPPSYSHLLGRLVQDGEDFARAKVALYKQLLALRVAQTKASVGLGMAALFLLEAVVVVLLVGLMLALASKVGFLWATLIVTAAGMILSIVLLTMARGALPDFSSNPMEEPIPLPEEPHP